METIVCANAKGGILKSSLALTMAEVLSSMGKKVLLIDTDYQGNSSKVMRANTSRSIYGVLTGAYPIRSAIQEIEIGHMVASSREMALLDSTLTGSRRVLRLRDALEDIKDLFDYVIIDTPPSLGQATMNALAAADEVIIPTQADGFSIDGIKSLLTTIETVKQVNPEIHISGILRTRYNDRSNLSRYATQQLKELAEDIGTVVYDAYIRENVKAKEAQMMLEPLLKYDPTCNAAVDYQNFVKEYLERKEKE